MKATKINASSRRAFMTQSFTMACGVFLADSSLLNAAITEKQVSGQDDLIRRMKWLNDPASWNQSGDKLIVHSRPKTDFWRKTFYGYITTNVNFFHLPVAGDFVFEARISGRYGALYDQAGLMVRVDAENWVKCGTEFVDGVRHASVVFTREFSDWSTMNDLTSNGPVWWR